MNLIDTPIASFQAERPNLLARAWNRMAGWIVEICASDEPSDDPTAQFSPREWADLPTHHPASDK